MAYCPHCKKDSLLIVLDGEVISCGWCGYRGYSTPEKSIMLDKVC